MGDAVAGRAAVLVSADKDLLSLAGRLSCIVLAPADFLATLAAADRP